MKKKIKGKRAFLIILAAVLISLPSCLRLLESFELSTLDLRFAIRPRQAENSDIAIIEIANDTLEKIGKWPLKRSYHAAIIDILSAFGARSVIFDALFSEPSPEDAAFAEASKKAGNVYYGFSFKLPGTAKDGYIESDKIDTGLIPELKNSSRGYGFINAIPDIDGKTRRVPLIIRYNGKDYPHLSLLAAADYLGLDTAEIGVPLDSESCALVNYSGKWNKSFSHYSYVDILKSYSLISSGKKGVIDLNIFKGKVCFIGLTATGTQDLNPSPLEKRYPGLGVHINLFNMITTGNFLRRVSRFSNLIILLILAFTAALVTLKTRPLTSSIFIITVIAAFCFAAIGFFIFVGLWIDLFYPIIALFIVYLSCTFYKYVSERQKRQLIEKELEVAQKIQVSFLPQKPPESQHLVISADMLPAKQVGGDLYDFTEPGNKKVGIMIGDVSGKGVPAALYMAKAVSLFRIFSRQCPGTKEAVAGLNDALADESSANLFVTLSYIIYDPDKGLLTFSSGGHLPTMVLKKGQKKCVLLEAKEGLPLGLMACDFSEETVFLAKGDKVVLYTDGVTEAMSVRGEEFGQDRLSDVVEKNRSLGPESLLKAIKEEITEFSKSAPQHDDITIIVIEVK